MTGRGSYKMGGGASEVLSLRKGRGADIFLAVLKGGHNKFGDVFT